MTRFDPTGRFTDRVADYVRARPGYPVAMIEWLRTPFGIDADWSVADIGAGTGISSKLFLDAGHDVIAVEPNAAMRDAALGGLAANGRFHAVDGSAEHTTLPDHSVDLISAAQAFHWFDPAAVRREWSRILSARGLAVIYWNTRRLGDSEFLCGYEALLREFDRDYADIAAAHPDDTAMQAWFGTGFRGTSRFGITQMLDFDALVSRLMSSSHTPRHGDPQHAPLQRGLRELFDKTGVNGVVEMSYDTRVFVGTPQTDR